MYWIVLFVSFYFTKSILAELGVDDIDMPK